MKAKIVKNLFCVPLSKPYFDSFIGKEFEVIKQDESGYLLPVPAFAHEELPCTYWKAEEVEIVE